MTDLRRRHSHPALVAARVSAALLPPSAAADWDITAPFVARSSPWGGGDFSLTSAQGKVSLKDFRGKVVIISFGYTFCPDACPTSLAAIGEALKKMPAGEAAEVQPIFVTIDPARDDLKRLATYAEFFHPRMIGLGGSEAEVDAVAKRYRVFKRAHDVDSAGGYVVDHTSFIYIVGRRGELRQRIQHGATPTAIATELGRALAASR